MTPQPPEGSLVHVDGEPATFVKGMLKAADEAKRPWWKRRPKLRLPEKVTTDPTPATRYYEAAEKRGFDITAKVCACRGCRCHRLDSGLGGDPLRRCNPCRHGRHAPSRLARPQRQERGVPSPFENEKRLRARRKVARAV